MKKSIFFSVLMLGALVLAGCKDHKTPDTDTTKLWRAQQDESSEWGFINQKGKFVVPAKYTNVGKFSCGLAWVADGADYSYINKSGKVVGKSLMEHGANSFYYDYSVINIDGEYGFMDTKLKKLFVKDWQGLGDMSADGLAVFAEKGDKKTLCGYCDKKGEVKIKAQFDGAYAFAGGIAVVYEVSDNGEYRYGIIDTKGNYTYSLQKQPLFNLGQGLVAFMKDNGKWGIIDKKGNVKVDATYGDIEPFTDGLAMVRKVDASKYGFIDNKGNEKIDLMYASAKPFYEGVAWVKQTGDNKKWELIAKNGSSKFELAKNQSPSDSHYRQGLCLVSGDGKMIYFDQKGNEAYTWKLRGYSNNDYDYDWGAPARKAEVNPMEGTEYGPLFESAMEIKALMKK